MTVREIRDNWAQTDAEVSMLERSGVDSEIAAALVPMLSSASPSAYRAAHKFAAAHAYGLDLTDEGRADVARAVQGAKALVNTYRQSHGADVVEDFGRTAEERYAPGEKAANAALDLVDPMSRVPPTDISSVTGKRFEPEPLLLRDTSPLLLQDVETLTASQAEALDDRMLAAWDRS